MPLSKARMRERKHHDRLLVKPKSNLNIIPDVKPKIPLYNPSIHRAGDRVLVQQGKRLVDTVIPELDADGNPIPWGAL